MNRVCDRDKCTGCWACVNACPKQCISMKEGELRHLYPEVEQSLCVDCGLCQKVCPAVNPQEKNTPQIVYACWTKDEEECKSSTSGGMGATFARHIIQGGGVVYGCACMDDVNVRHIRVDKEEDLVLLKGSKYVQSSIRDCYCCVKEDLQKTDRKVLFVGTPCQIAGLRGFLRRDYDNLYLVDLICHGVPSVGYLREHLKNVTARTKYDAVRFREGRDRYCLSVMVEGEKIYSSDVWESRYEDVYYNAFIDGYTYRESCHACAYAEKNRVSDITIGDFWGLHDDIPVKHENGINCMLVNTSKGNALVEAVKESVHLYRRELSEAVNGNDQLRAPKGYNLRIRMFLKLQRRYGITKAYRMVEFDHVYHLNKVFGIYYLRRLIRKIIG